jgi:hypothetical protein
MLLLKSSEEVTVMLHLLEEVVHGKTELLQIPSTSKGKIMGMCRCSKQQGR